MVATYAIRCHWRAEDLACLFASGSGSVPDEYDGPRQVFVGRELFENAGVKFWVSLCDEIADEFSQCRTVRLDWSAGRVVLPEDLDPAAKLEREVEALLDADFDSVMREAVSELRMIGPPSGVRGRLFGEDENVPILDRLLPDDAVDAENMYFLLSWLLKFGGVDKKDWGNAELSGAFGASDQLRGKHYKISFALNRRMGHEGLHLFSLNLAPERRDA